MKTTFRSIIIAIVTIFWQACTPQSELLPSITLDKFHAIKIVMGENAQVVDAPHIKITDEEGNVLEEDQVRGGQVIYIERDGTYDGPVVFVFEQPKTSITRYEAVKEGANKCPDWWTKFHRCTVESNDIVGNIINH